MNQNQTKKALKVDFIIPQDSNVSPINRQQIQRIELQRRFVKNVSTVTIFSLPYLLLAGGGLVAGWLFFVYVLEPVLDFVATNFLLILLVIGLIITLILAIKLYPEFKATQRVKEMSQFTPPAPTETRIQTTRHDGITIQNFITIQNNGK